MEDILAGLIFLLTAILSFAVGVFIFVQAIAMGIIMGALLLIVSLLLLTFGALMIHHALFMWDVI